MNTNEMFLQILQVLEEQNIIKTTKTKPIVDAIKNRKKISFYYSGPRKPKKDSVKAGYRVKVEPVALGLSKTGKLIIRAWVQPPSTTKTGFQKGNWRTFILGRTNNVQITDEKFDSKRPGYKEGDDDSMTVTYVTSDWTKTPDVPKQPQKPKSKEEKPVSKPQKVEPEVVPTEPEKVELTPQELPQPKPEEKPEPSPTDKEVEVQNKPEELPQPKPEEKPKQNPEDEVEDEKNLQESLKRIKSLMLL